MIYTVTLNPAIDYVVQLPGLQVGGINRNQKEDIQFGGKGINVSGVLKALGIPNVALGFVAGFTGAGLEKGLQTQGISTDFIHVTDGLTRINVKVKAGEETEINGIGPVITEADLQKLYAQLDALQPGDYLVLSGSVPGCLGADTYEKILQRLAGREIRTVVDATGKALLGTLQYRPFLIKPNHHELGELFGKTLTSAQEIEACARKMQEMGAQNVLVSMAGDGAILLDDQGNCYRIPCPKGQVVNSVAAGDSMVAGFLAGLSKKQDYGYALKLGTAAGSATAFSLGLGTKELIYELLEQLERSEYGSV